MKPMTRIELEIGAITLYNSSGTFDTNWYALEPKIRRVWRNMFRDVVNEEIDA